MITIQQQRQAIKEFAAAANRANEQARLAERAMEDYAYRSGPAYDSKHAYLLRKQYAEADYLAESRAWILELMLKDCP